MACVGFVGLGAMGAPMAANLARAGRKVVLCDARPGAARALADTFAGGAEVAGSPAELAAREDVEVVVSMLPGAAQVEEVYLGTDGLLSETERFRPKLLIDSSTTGPEMARELHAVSTCVRRAGRGRGLTEQKRRARPTPRSPWWWTPRCRGACPAPSRRR